MALGREIETWEMVGKEQRIRSLHWVWKFGVG